MLRYRYENGINYNKIYRRKYDINAKIRFNRSTYRSSVARKICEKSAITRKIQKRVYAPQRTYDKQKGYDYIWNDIQNKI